MPLNLHRSKILNNLSTPLDLLIGVLCHLIGYYDKSLMGTSTIRSPKQNKSQNSSSIVHEGDYIAPAIVIHKKPPSGPKIISVTRGDRRATKHRHSDENSTKDSPPRIKIPRNDDSSDETT